MNGAARAVHIRRYLIAPAEVMLGLFVRRRGFFIAVDLVKHELCGIVFVLKHVKADVSRLQS